jgi:hypothetical protein
MLSQQARCSLWLRAEGGLFAGKKEKELFHRICESSDSGLSIRCLVSVNNALGDRLVKQTIRGLCLCLGLLCITGGNGILDRASRCLQLAFYCAVTQTSLLVGFVTLFLTLDIRHFSVPFGIHRYSSQ